MDEEQMWKSFYEKLEEIKMNPPTEHEYKLQDADGGFFEKFGSLLRQKSHFEEDNLRTNLAPFAETNNEINEAPVVVCDSSGPVAYPASSEQNIPQMEELNFHDNKQDIELTKEKAQDFIGKAFGMNIDDLYEEILFEINNNVGCESSDYCTENLIEFAQDVFKMPNSKHQQILELVQNKEPPKIRLNVEIIKAECLLPKDSNGLSDPFVTLYLESSGTHRYNSSVKKATLNPIWEEHFSLPIVENPRNEVLIVEVWDFDAAETVKEKVNKLFDVKGVKGLSKLMKEIALAASTGRHENELIGRVAITLKSIPVSGITVWHNLEKGFKTKSRGSLLVNLTLSAEKNKHVAIQEHRHLLKLLLIHELETSKVAYYYWNGKFDSKAEAIRAQHAVQSGLSNFDCALSQWYIFAAIHEDHPLSFELFNLILDLIIPNLKYLPTDCEEVKIFWDSVKKILPSCFLVLRELRKKNLSDKHVLKSLCDVLDIISKIKEINLPQDVDLFPKNIYGWIDCDEKTDITLDIAIEHAIGTGTTEWFEHILEGTKHKSSENPDEDQLQFLIKLVQMVRADIQKAIEYFDKHFYQKIRLNYSTILYKFYDTKLTEIAQTIVKDVCSHIKRLDISDEQFEVLPNIDDINMGTTLFELYLVIKRFLVLGKSLCPNNELAIEKYYLWFTTGVIHWLDISVIKALNRIKKAIELDQLHAVDDTVKYSSSAVDTLAIFYQIKIFWQQLDWPDAEGSYTFVAKIVDDICRCCVFYAQTMSRRVDMLANETEELFTVSTEWCLAINNIDYIRQSLPSFIKELRISDVIDNLRKYRTNLEADRCAVTIDNVIENARDTETNQIFELIDHVAKKMVPTMRRFLTEGAEVLHVDSNSMEKMMMYLENSLGILYESLNESNFARILDSIWSEISCILYDIVQTNLEKKRPPAFFHNLREALNIMISSFKLGDVATSDKEILKEIKRILDLHAFETSDLIHQYYLERLGIQKSSSKSEYGQLTIQVKFVENQLLLRIMNARNLVPMDSNGKCDTFVKAYFLPINRFIGTSPVKTSVQHKTRFPLYDEEFTIYLTDEQLSKRNSLILFSIKDKDLFGMTNQYVAECYITFADLIANENEQIHMELTRPEYTDSDTIRALEQRQGDKQAKEFLKKLKNKSYI